MGRVGNCADGPARLIVGRGVMGRRKHQDIEIRGVVYPTVVDAARALDVTTNTVFKAIYKGTLHRVGTAAVGREPMPILVRGKVYENAAEAAAANNVSRPAVYAALSRGRPDRIGIRGAISPHGAKQFKVAGLVFPSLAAADRAFGFTPGYISRSLRSGSPRAAERIMGAAMLHKQREYDCG